MPCQNKGTVKGTTWGPGRDSPSSAIPRCILYEGHWKASVGTPVPQTMLKALRCGFSIVAVWNSFPPQCWSHSVSTIAQCPRQCCRESISQDNVESIPLRFSDRCTFKLVSLTMLVASAVAKPPPRCLPNCTGVGWHGNIAGGNMKSPRPVHGIAVSAQHCTQHMDAAGTQHLVPAVSIGLDPDACLQHSRSTLHPAHVLHRMRDTLQ